MSDIMQPITYDTPVQFGFGTHPRDGSRYCYQPCWDGLSVTAIHPDGKNCITLRNHPTRTATEAQALFDKAKAELESQEGEPCDYIVDLNMNSYIEDDFYISRQMLSRLEQLVAALQPKEGE